MNKGGFDMKLFLNYTGSTTVSGKVRFNDVQELLLLEEALKYYKEYLINKPGEKSEKLYKKIDSLEKLIYDLQLENADKSGKKYDSSIGINLNHFLITMRHRSKVLLIELAEKLNISPSYYNDIEKEKTEASAEIMMGIFEALNVLPNIKVKLYPYIPTIEYYYNDIKFHEVFLAADDTYDYDHYADVVIKKLPDSNIETVNSKPDL
jgi:transcriptional regulator with XRE-family HTH domain